MLTLVAASVLVVVGMSYYYSSHNTPPCADPDSISGHVYNPSRLDIIRSCQYQYGDLVVEIICALPITQSDAMSACQNYTNNITIPSIDDHITVTGPYILDTAHYNWAEIHPVYTLTIS